MNVVNNLGRNKASASSLRTDVGLYRQAFCPVRGVFNFAAFKETISGNCTINITNILKKHFYLFPFLHHATPKLHRGKKAAEFVQFIFTIFQ